MLKLQVEDFDKQSWEFELNDLIFNFKMERFDYIRKNCVACIKNRLQEKKNCSLLKGFKEPICDPMSKNIRNKLHEQENKLINTMIQL